MTFGVLASFILFAQRLFDPLRQVRRQDSPLFKLALPLSRELQDLFSASRRNS